MISKRHLLGLYSAQIGSMLIPLVTLPWLILTLGVESYGILAWVYSITMFAVFAVDCGINTMAIQGIFARRDHAKKLHRYFGAVQAARIVLCLFSVAFLMLLVMCFKKSSQYWYLFAFCALNIVGTLTFPAFYWVGIERGDLIAYANVGGRLLSSLLLFALVHSSEDLTLAVLLQSIAGLISGVAFYWHYVRNVGGIPLVWRYAQMKVLLRQSNSIRTHEFVFQAMQNLPVFALGIYQANHVVGVYASLEKLFRALATALNPLNHAFTSYVHKLKARRLYRLRDRHTKWYLYGVSALVTLGAGALVLLAVPVLKLSFNWSIDKHGHVFVLFQLCCMWMAVHCILKVLETCYYISNKRWKQLINICLPVQILGLSAIFIFAPYGAVQVLSVIIAVDFVCAGLLFLLRDKK
ncbi:MAG: hypothetical protein RLZZ502_1606 [Pseudomonadota bacterium]